MADTLILYVMTSFSAHLTRADELVSLRTGSSWHAPRASRRLPDCRQWRQHPRHVPNAQPLVRAFACAQRPMSMR